jgi:hypothetical protein
MAETRKEKVVVEATWGSSQPIAWHMSAALENVPRGESELAEVTSLARAVAEWRSLDPAHQLVATLTLEHPVLVDGVQLSSLSGASIETLAKRLPASYAVNYQAL